MVRKITMILDTQSACHQTGQDLPSQLQNTNHLEQAMTIGGRRNFMSLEITAGLNLEASMERLFKTLRDKPNKEALESASVEMAFDSPLEPGKMMGMEKVLDILAFMISTTMALL